MRYKVNEKLGKKIAKIRKEKNMSQEDLAAKVGIHYTTLSGIERGESDSPVHTIDKIAQALRVSIRDLF